MKTGLLFIVFLLTGYALCAQEEPAEEEKKGFKKENLFTGGSISLAFGNRFFLIGGVPVLGYSFTKWADAGVVVNYTYTSQRDFYSDRWRRTVYGGGVFTRLFPVRFLFAQAQVERNFIRQKYLPQNGSDNIIEDWSASSVLVGGGYTTGRYPGSGNPYYYLSILFDVTRNANSPYVDAGRAIPIIRAGVNVPLFQGSRRSRY